MSTFHKATLCGNLQVKCCRPNPRTTLCAGLRNRNACQHFAKATLYGNLQVKRCRPNPRTTLCASLRSWNALQHFTRATLYGNLQEKCPRPKWAPWSSTGLYTYRKNPSVWTRCLGKMAMLYWFMMIMPFFRLCSMIYLLKIPLWMTGYPLVISASYGSHGPSILDDFWQFNYWKWWLFMAMFNYLVVKPTLLGCLATSITKKMRFDPFKNIAT